MKLERLTLLGMVALTAISTDLYLSGIPQIVADFSASAAEGQLTLGVFLIGVAVGQLIYGPLSDFYGRKPVLRIGLIIYLLSTLACAFSMSMDQLLIARLCQALAAASGPVLARAIVSDLYSPRDAGKMLAMLTAYMAIIPAIAPIFGSWLLYWFDWRMQFGLLSCFGVLVLMGASSLVESKPRVAGATISYKKIGQQFSLALRHSVFMSYAMMGAAQIGAMFAWISIASFVIIEQFSVAPENFGYAFAIVVCGFFCGGYISSKTIHRFGPMPIIVAGLACSFLSALLMLVLAIAALDNLPLVLLSAFGVFFSGGMVLSNAQMGAITVFPDSTGQSSSIFGFLQSALAALSGILVGQFYNNTMMPLAISMGVMTLIAWFCLAVIRAKHRHQQVPI